MRHTFAAILLALGLVATACGDSGTSVFELAVGDCFNDEDLEAEVITDVPTVPCSEPHDNEIYYEFTMTDSVYPGRDAAFDTADQRCLEQFEAFVGIDYFESDLDLFSIVPTAESWAEGDRGSLCAVYAVDLSKLTGSMRGAAR
jgi:hypothetical protein